MRRVLIGLLGALAVVASAHAGRTAAALATDPVQAAFAAHAAGLVRFGVAFEHGEGVVRDPQRAAACYCEAARQGSAEGMYALGWMYANARGVPRDDRYAGTLFAMAAMLGNEQAARMQRFTGDYTGDVPECLEAPLWEQYDGLVERLMTRLSPARRAVVKLVINMAPEYGIEPRLAIAIAAVESAFNPLAVSPKNAQGVMQLIPDTAARFKVGDILDARQNIAGGLSYLRWLLAYFEGDVRLVAAAYNAGEGAVDRYGGVPPYPETQTYVERVLGYYHSESHPYEDGVVESSPMLARLRLTSQ